MTREEAQRRAARAAFHILNHAPEPACLSEADDGADLSDDEEALMDDAWEALLMELLRRGTTPPQDQESER